MTKLFKFLVCSCVFIWSGLVYSEIVYVKYRGPVDLGAFKCESFLRSSLVDRVCYDKRESYMIISLQGVYYHYCEIDEATVKQLINAVSMGSYYNAAIKGRFDCRVRRVPGYR